MQINNNNKNRNKHRIMSEINVTPFVDVMLVLLIIFMVTAPMLVTGVDVDLPEASTNPVSSNEEPLTVSIDKFDKIYIMNKEINKKDLIPKLKNILNEKKESRIFVRADKRSNYGYIMNIIGKINEAGFNKISLITDRNNGN
jgi:biopolymer transport protein TolR